MKEDAKNKNKDRIIIKSRQFIINKRILLNDGIKE